MGTFRLEVCRSCEACFFEDLVAMMGQLPGEMSAGAFACAGDWGLAGSRDGGQLGKTPLTGRPLVFPSCV